MNKIALSGYQQYKQIDVGTASEGRLVVMLYDRMIRCLNQAKQEFNKRDNGNGEGQTWIERFHNNIIKVQEILGELINALNLKEGGEISKNLFTLYFYIFERLTEADLYKKTEEIDVALNLLIPLREAWEQAERDYRYKRRYG